MIETEDYLIQKMNYIHTNPVRRQYVKKPKIFRFKLQT